MREPTLLIWPEMVEWKAVVKTFLVFIVDLASVASYWNYIWREAILEGVWVVSKHKLTYFAHYEGNFADLIRLG